MKVIIDLPDTTIAAFVNYVYRDTFGFGHDEGMNVKGFTKNELNAIRVDESVETKTSTKGGEWIPVSEKLPREDQKCLVCHKGAIGIDEFIGHDLPYKWRIYLRDYDAWMPLPEPYKESDTE